MDWSPVEVGGWLGAISCLLGYALVSAGRLSGKSLKFALLNILGSSLLGWNGYAHQAWPAVFVNGVWLLIGVVSFVTQATPSTD